VLPLVVEMLLLVVAHEVIDERWSNVAVDDVANLLAAQTTFQRSLWKTTVVQVESSRAKALPKNLIHPLRVLDRKDKSSGDLLCRTPVHIDARDGEATAVA
jgi:uncharacterized membrane protein affecting hemolysin expression